MPDRAQPYIYSPPSRHSSFDPYNGFDPKPFTRASFAPPSPPRPKQQGPLLDFNRHPDSYLIVPYGKTSMEPMSPKTKTWVKVARRSLLAVRSIQMIGALGLLVCVSAVRNIGGTDSYIVRAPPIVDVVTLLYAIYHLCRSFKARSPGSSASYHFFALIIDLGLVALYVLTALLADTNMKEQIGSEERWTSAFHKYLTDTPLISTIWIDAMVLGFLHLVSMIQSAFLGRTFFKITQLPPDMNPLEDNLTSRRKSKHKVKNSDMSSASTLVGKSASSGSLSPSKVMIESEVRSISFMQTRKNSDTSYNSHNPAITSLSGMSPSIPAIPLMYQHPRTQVSSNPGAAKELPLDAQETCSERSHTFLSEPSSHHPTMLSSSSVYSDHLSKNDTPPLPRKSSKRRSLLSDNWFVYPFGMGTSGESARQAVSAVDEIQDDDQIQKTLLGFGRMNNRQYKPIRQQRQMDDEDHELDFSHGRHIQKMPPALSKTRAFDFKPLGMNPPTPPLSRQDNANISKRAYGDRPLSSLSGNESRSGSPSKQKRYGDLAAAMKGIRHAQRDSAIDMSSGEDFGIDRKDWTADNARSHQGDGKGRVVSRSGAELDDAFYKDAKNLRGRNVSGKVAEEGRVGW